MHGAFHSGPAGNSRCVDHGAVHDVAGDAHRVADELLAHRRLARRRSRPARRRDALPPSASTTVTPSPSCSSARRASRSANSIRSRRLHAFEQREVHVGAVDDRIRDCRSARGKPRRPAAATSCRRSHPSSPCRRCRPRGRARVADAERIEGGEGVRDRAGCRRRSRRSAAPAPAPSPRSPAAPARVPPRARRCRRRRPAPGSNSLPPFRPCSVSDGPDYAGAGAIASKPGREARAQCRA